MVNSNHHNHDNNNDNNNNNDDNDDNNNDNKFVLYWVGGVTTESLSFVSVTGNAIAPGTLEIPQLADQFRVTLFSNLINDTSRVLQKLHKSFTATITSELFLSSALILFINFDQSGNSRCISQEKQIGFKGNLLP